jgi:outer membrane protein W
VLSLLLRAVAAVGLIGLIACGEPTLPLQTAAPGVVFTYPIDAQLDVPLGTRIVVTFSDPMVSSAVSAFSITGPAGPVAGTPEITNDGRSIQVADAALDPGTTYEVAIRRELAPDAENLPASGPLFRFTTRSGVTATATASTAAASTTTTTPRHKRFYVRAGIAHVAPLSSSRPMELADIDGAASLAVENGPIAGSGADVSSATIPALILGYQLPVLDGRLAIETVLGVPFTVKFRATGTLANESIAPMALGIPTGVPALGPELGEAKAAPPLLTLVYSLRKAGPVRPYVGAGVAVLIAYGEKVTNPMLIEVSQPTMNVAPAPGLVVQGGLEAKLWNNVYARLDVKFIAFMMARGEVHHIQVRTPELPLFDTVEVGTAKMSVWVNPLIIQGGVGLDF